VAIDWQMNRWRDAIVVMTADGQVPFRYVKVWCLWWWFIVNVYLAVDCLHPGRWTDGRMHLINASTTFLSLAEYRCPIGARLVDGESIHLRVCEADGHWSGHAPICRGQYVFGITSFSSISFIALCQLNFCLRNTLPGTGKDCKWHCICA
jgi:hypothetical protein